MFGPCFVMQYLVSFIVCHYLAEEKRAGCFTFLGVMWLFMLSDSSSPCHDRAYQSQHFLVI